MDLDEEQSDTGEMPTDSRIRINEETGETEENPSSEAQQSETLELENDVQNSKALEENIVPRFEHTKPGEQESQKLNELQSNFFQHRTNELIPSDEDSGDSNTSANSHRSQPYTLAELIIKQSGIFELEKNFDMNETIHYHNDDIRTQRTYEKIIMQLNKAIMKSELSESSDSFAKEHLERTFPGKSNEAHCSSSAENNLNFSRIQRLNSFFRPEHLDCHTRKVSEIPSKRRPESPYPKFSHNATKCIRKSCSSSELDTYKMISDPIKDNNNTHTSLDTFPPSPKFERFSNISLSETAEEIDSANFEIPRRKFFHSSLELPSTSKHNIDCTKEDLNASDDFSLPNFKIQERFSHSPEHSRYPCQHARPVPTARPSTNCQTSVSLSFLPNSCSKRSFKSSRKLNCDDSSSDEALEIGPGEKPTQKRRKTFPFYLSSSSENSLTFETFSKTDNVENISKDVQFSSSPIWKPDQKLSNFKETVSPDSERSSDIKGNMTPNSALCYFQIKENVSPNSACSLQIKGNMSLNTSCSSQIKENVSPNNAPCSSEIIHPENVEACQLSRKRVISKSKSESDIEDAESKQIKRSKTLYKQ